MARVRLRLLGGFDLRTDGRPTHVATKKARALLAYLAMRQGELQARDKIAALLWGDMSDARARANVRQTWSLLGKALPEGALESEGGGLTLVRNALELDVAEFSQAATETSAPALVRAAETYAGDLLEGLAVEEAGFEEWLVGERERLRELALQALARLLAMQTREGDDARAIATALRLLHLDPLQESVHRALMRLYGRRGQRASGLRQYQRCVAVLQQELNTGPEEETKQLYQELLRMRAVEPQSAASWSSGAPLIGRQVEMAKLHGALDAIGSRTQGAFVLIRGEAGVGKTRLLEALAEAGSARGSMLLVGRACESSQVLPFAPWVDALRMANVAGDETLLSELAPAFRSELGRLLPELPPGAPSNDALRLFASVHELLGRLAARRPLVLLLEDLHWADEMSWRLLAYVARRAGAHPIVFAATLREEDIPWGPVVSAVRAEVEELPHTLSLGLPALGRGEASALVKAFARSHTGDEQLHQLDDVVWSVSEGNPFVALETLRALEEGTLAPGASTLPLPARVRELVTRRMARLSETSRHVLATAAVIGRTFEFALLREAAGVDEAAAAEALEELVRQRMLSAFDDHFDLAHQRIREVVKAELLAPRRALLHGQIASAIEVVFARDLSPHHAAAAFHNIEAGRWERAVFHLQKAGAQAASRSGHGEAIAFFTQAVAALRNLPESPAQVEQGLALRLAMFNSLVSAGAFEKIGACLEEALVLAEKTGTPLHLAQVHGATTFGAWMMAEYAAAIETGRRTRALAEAAGDLGLLVEANFLLGVLHTCVGSLNDAVAAFRDNVALLVGDQALVRRGPAIPYLATRCWLAWALADQGEFDEAMTRAQEMEPVARALVPDWANLSEAYSARGLVFLYRGDHELAVVEWERATAIAREQNNFPVLVACAGYLGGAYLFADRLDDAERSLMEALDVAKKVRLVVQKARWLTFLARVHLRRGRIDEATRWAEEALSLARWLGERSSEAYALHALGEIGVAGRFAEARALAEELGMRPLVAHCHLGAGELAEAARLFRQLKMDAWCARATAAIQPPA